MNFNFEEGELLLVDKPYRWSSFDIVKKIKYLFKIKKIGHAGTLDPLATGLMVLGTGKKTKALNDLQGLDKTYTGIITLGKTTPSYDLETPFDQTFPTHHITTRDIEQVASEFVGKHTQTPPVYSAVKVDGQRAYKAARKGKDIKMKERTVQIDAFDILSVRDLDIHFKIECSKGTYIRSIAHDFGQALDSGAHLSELRRTAVGDFHIEEAYTLEELIKLKEQA